jgi:hypothetical protein
MVDVEQTDHLGQEGGRYATGLRVQRRLVLGGSLCMLSFDVGDG